MDQSHRPFPRLITRLRVVVLIGTVLTVAVLLHPPWIATAVLARMDYTGFPAKPPRMVNDTVSWKVPFAPVYSRPALDLDPSDLAGYQKRLSSGDTAAGAEWQRRIESLEKRYRVPDKLRSVWSRGAAAGSPNAVAYRRSIVSSYFEVDRTRLAIHLFAVGIATLAAAFAARRLSSG